MSKRICVHWTRREEQRLAMLDGRSLDKMAQLMGRSRLACKAKCKELNVGYRAEKETLVLTSEVVELLNLKTRERLKWTEVVLLLPAERKVTGTMLRQRAAYLLRCGHIQKTETGYVRQGVEGDWCQ